MRLFLPVRQSKHLATMKILRDVIQPSVYSKTSTNHRNCFVSQKFSSAQWRFTIRYKPSKSTCVAFCLYAYILIEQYSTLFSSLTWLSDSCIIYWAYLRSGPRHFSSPLVRHSCSWLPTSTPQHTEFRSLVPTPRLRHIDMYKEMRFQGYKK